MLAGTAFAGVVEDWTNVAKGTNIGAYADTNGSKVDFAAVSGPKGAQALKITSHIAQGGYAGIWRNWGLGLAKSPALSFPIKSSAAGEVQVSLVDAYHVQYIANVKVSSGDWTDVSVPLASFAKNPYYTPSDAVTGHAADFSKVTSLNLAAQMGGDSVVEVGPISAENAVDLSNLPAEGPALLQDFAGLASDSYGSFQDKTGSTAAASFADNPKKKGAQILTFSYNLVAGGYAGLWMRAGANWDGVNIKGLKTLVLKVRSKGPVVLGLALTDKAHNQYSADAPMTKGGKWETLKVSLDSFKLDPYYTPPDAVKGAPQDFSQVRTLNLSAKTEGKADVEVESIKAE
jgi:hypothetical protein